MGSPGPGHSGAYGKEIQGNRAWGKSGGPRSARTVSLESQVSDCDGLSEIYMTQELEPVSDVYMIVLLGGVATDPLAPGIIWVLKAVEQGFSIQIAGGLRAPSALQGDPWSAPRGVRELPGRPSGFWRPSKSSRARLGGAPEATLGSSGAPKGPFKIYARTLCFQLL